MIGWGFWTLFVPDFRRTFHHPEVPVFEALSFIECVRGVLHAGGVSRGRIYSAGWVSCASSAYFMRPGCWFYGVVRGGLPLREV